MKKLLSISILTVLTAALTLVGAQNYPDEYLGLPGDNLNLYAVMKLFQESETLEGFERALNDENSRINNLDLNGDNYVDYLTVSDYVNGNVHTIVLRAMLNQNESQDVAVFTVEKFRDGSVQIQLIGDEALYGRNYIIEPNYAETPNPGYTGTAAYRRNVNVVYTTYYDIAAWPLIRFIYHPYYVVWRSSWYWGYYPVYWNPWRPYYWHYYYGYHYHWHPHYYAHYRHWNHYRCRHYKTYYYTSIRTYSPTVIVNINKNQYRATYSRPELRRDGEALYARTHADRSAGTRNPATVNRQTTRPVTTQQARVNNTVQRSTGNTTRTTSTVSRSPDNRGYEGRSTSSAPRSTPAVNNSRQTVSNTGRSAQTAPRSAPAVSNSRQTPTTASRGTVQSSSNTRSSATVQKSTGTSRSSSAVQRSSSSSPRSSATVQKSTGTSRSSSAVQRSNSSSPRSSATVQKSTGTSRSSSAVQRSSSGSSRSSASVQRSSSSGSSKSGSSAASRSGSSSGSRSSSSPGSRTSRR